MATKSCITNVRRKKMSEASHTTGKLAKAKWIALGTGGVDANRNVIEPLPTSTGLKKEVVRKEYTSSTKKSDTCYEYELKLGELEYAGTYFSELALIDEDGDAIAILNFLEKGKDETEVSFYVEDNY
jgi:hypothetical protein